MNPFLRRSAQAILNSGTRDLANQVKAHQCWVGYKCECVVTQQLQVRKAPTRMTGKDHKSCMWIRDY
jgi:hypothetical protein